MITRYDLIDTVDDGAGTFNCIQECDMIDPIPFDSDIHANGFYVDFGHRNIDGLNPWHVADLLCQLNNRWPGDSFVYV